MRRLAVVGLLVLVALAGCRAPAEKPPAEAAEAASLTKHMRMPWSRQGAEFLRTWLVCGPFPNPPHEGDQAYDHTPPCVGLQTDYLTAHGGEPHIRPAPGTAHSRPDGATAVWREHTAPSERVDFRQVFSDRPTENVVAYAYTTVERERAGPAVLAVGSDDGVRIWLNGSLVHDPLVGRGIRPDDDVVSVELTEGTNHLLVKVEQGSGGWGFMLRVLGAGEAAALEADGRGNTSYRGIGVAFWHEPCTATYDLADAGWSRLRAVLGIEIDEPAQLEPKQKANTRVFFVVRGDGEELYRSPVFRWDSRPVELDLDVSGVSELQLKIGNEARWHCAASSINWADLRLEK
ncbi:MAG: NPCBM/NEW2 domain-containing protein [Planctomycetota bacterium]